MSALDKLREPANELKILFAQYPILQGVSHHTIPHGWISILKAFVPAAEIPPQYYETPYYLAPADRGEKVYALLRETLRAAGRVAVAQVVIRTTEHLAAVVPQGRALMLVTMRHADEIRGASGFELPAEGLKSAGVSTRATSTDSAMAETMVTENWR